MFQFIGIFLAIEITGRTRFNSFFCIIKFFRNFAAGNKSNLFLVNEEGTKIPSFVELKKRCKREKKS